MNDEKNRKKNEGHHHLASQYAPPTWSLLHGANDVMSFGRRGSSEAKTMVWTTHMEKVLVVAVQRIGRGQPRRSISTIKIIWTEDVRAFVGAD